MSESDTPPAHIWQTIYQRALFSFESALSGPEQKYYGSDEVISDYSKQYSKLFYSMNIFYFISLFISYFLLNSTASAEVAIRVPFIEIEGLTLTSELLILVLSVTYVWFLQRFFSGLLLGTAIFRIIESCGFTTPGYILARQLPFSLWVELIRYHSIGYASGLAHRIILLSLFGFMFLALVSQMAFINYATLISYLQIYDKSVFSFLISTLSTASILVATLMAFVSFAIPLKFEFQPPGDSIDAPLP